MSMAKDVLKKVYQYIIKTMNGMAYGFFSTLIISTIYIYICQFIKF